MGGGLNGAVGSDEAEALPGCNREIYTPHDSIMPEVFG